MQVVFNILKLFLYLSRLFFKWTSPWEMARTQNIQTKLKQYQI